MAKYDLVTFGETMVRLSPPNFKRIEQTSSLDVNVGGAEMNVAVAVARLGLDAAYISRLTDNPLGRLIRNKARELGVDTSHILWTDADRAGIYFLEFGASPRPSAVIYDRANSAISKIKPGEVDWKSIFSDCRLFHTSGITPALSDSAAEATKEALKAAKDAGVTTSIDLNYRARLWNEDKAQTVMTELMEYTDILECTEEDTFRVFKIKGKDYKEVAGTLTDKFGFSIVGITLRETISVWRNKWTALAYSEGKFYETATYDIEIVDRVGAGDSFTAGMLWGYLKGDLQKGVDLGVAFSALKQTTPGDLNFTTIEEAERIMSGAGLRIVR